MTESQAIFEVLDPSILSRQVKLARGVWWARFRKAYLKSLASGFVVAALLAAGAAWMWHPNWEHAGNLAGGFFVMVFFIAVPHALASLPFFPTRRLVEHEQREYRGEIDAHLGAHAPEAPQQSPTASSPD